MSLLADFDTYTKENPDVRAWMHEYPPMTAAQDAVTPFAPMVRDIVILAKTNGEMARMLRLGGKELS